MAERAPSSSSPRALLCSLLLCACAAPVTERGRTVVRGPLETRIEHPLALNLLGPRPRRAAPSGAGQWRLAWQNAYSSIFEENQRGREEVLFDGEYGHSNLSLRHGLTERTDLEVTLGTLYTTSGFLDAFADTFHDSLALPDGGRERFERDQYQMFLRDGDDVLFQLEEDRWGFLDLPIWLTHAVVLETESSPGVALRAGVELPLGSERRGFGNGTLDWGAGVLLEKSLQRLTLTGGVDFVLTGESERFEDANAEIDEVVQVALGGEYRMTEATSLLLQLLWYSPLVSDFRLEEINREILDLGVGFSTDLTDGTRLYGAFHEDLVAAAGSDFTMTFGLLWTF